MQEDDAEDEDEAPAGAAGGSADAADNAPSGSGAAAAAAEQHAAKRVKFSKLGKDPGVATAFLPDIDRELEEHELREQLTRVRPRAGGQSRVGGGRGAARQACKQG